MTRPAVAAATISTQLEPSAVPPAQQEPDVATDPLEVDPEPPITTQTKKKKKKSKKN